MSVIVPNGMPVDQALRLLWRESIRENIPTVVQSLQYRVKASEEKHAKKKLWMKTKTKGRSARRKIRRKGILKKFI